MDNNTTGFVRLVRVEDDQDEGTFGILTLDGKAFCVTLERPDYENARNMSSIPPGQYRCERYASQKYPDTWEITHVPNRMYVLFHAGNTVDDTRGCTLLGAYFSKLRGQRAVLNSGNTFNEFMQQTRKYKTLRLTIVEAY